MQFGTSLISPLYRYAPIKKDLSVSEKSLLVNLRGDIWDIISSSMQNLNDKLETVAIDD
jgi:hypothetical protein